MKNQLVYSELESKRFEMNIYRGVLDKIDLNYINKTILENSADITIFRIPTSFNADIPKLSKLGFPYLQADTLVYYYADFTKYQIKPIVNTDLEFIDFSSDKIDVLSKLVDEIFVGYTNHYDSNPYIDKQKIMEGYKEWMLGFINDPNKIGWFVQRNGQYIGFASCSEYDGVAEGVLYGVIPAAAGGGVYTDIIRFTQNFMFKKGIMNMKVSTQIQNHAVQKVWSREGFVLKETFATIHINSFLKATKLPIKTFDFVISEQDIENFGKISGDFNPIHFDDDFAKSVGLQERIAHGLIPNSLISKYYGTEFPGNGTLFLSYGYKFFRPLYPNANYKVIISFPYYVQAKGIYLSVVKIVDENQNLCVLSYNDLMKK